MPLLFIKEKKKVCQLSSAAGMSRVCPVELQPPLLAPVEASAPDRVSWVFLSPLIGLMSDCFNERMPSRDLVPLYEKSIESHPKT